jgi:hypothetical protein
MIRFSKPSAWRYFWSTIGAAFLVYVATVIVVYVLRLLPTGSVKTQSSNKYLGLLMWDMIFAAPVVMLTFSFVTIPVIAALGIWWAWAHGGADKTATSASSESFSTPD